MGIKLSTKRREDANISVGFFILVTLIIFLVIFFTVSCKALKIRPRQLPPEDTNAVNHIQLNWLASASPPMPQEPPPTGYIPQTLLCFTNELTFPWYPGMEGTLLVWRTPDWQNYTMLSYILFDDAEKFKTNDDGDVFQVIGFVDLYPLPGHAFYEGVILTNRP